MSNKKVKSTSNKQDQETSFRKLSTKYAQTAAVEDKRGGGSGKNNNSSQFSFKNEKKGNMADSAQSTVRKENKALKRPYDNRQDEKGRRNKAGDVRIPVGVKQYARYKKTQNSSEDDSNASVQSNKRQKAVLLSVKKPKHLKNLDSVTQDQQKTQLKPQAKRKETPKAYKLLFYKSEQTKSSPKNANPKQTKNFPRQSQNHEQQASNNEFMANQNSHRHQNIYQPQYTYKKNIHEKGEDKKLRLKNKLGFIIDMANNDETASVSYYSQSSLDSKNSQSKRSRNINQLIKNNKNPSLIVQRQKPQQTRQPQTRKMVFPSQKQERSQNNEPQNNKQQEAKKVNKVQNQSSKKKQGNIRQNIIQKESQQDIKEQKVERKHIIMHKKTSSDYKKIKEKEKQQEQQEQQQKEGERYKDKQQHKDSNRRKQENRLKSKPRQQQKQKQRTKQRQRQKLIQLQRQKQKEGYRLKQIKNQIQKQKQMHKQRQRQKQKEKERERQAQTKKQMQTQRQIQRPRQKEKDKEKQRQRQRQIYRERQQKQKQKQISRQRQRQRLKQNQRQRQKDKSKQRAQQKQKKQEKQRTKQQKYNSKSKIIQSDIIEDDFDTVKNESEGYFKNPNSNSNFQIKLQKVLIDDPIPKQQSKRYVTQQKQQNKALKRLNFDKEDTAQYQQYQGLQTMPTQMMRAVNSLRSNKNEEIAELMKKNDEYLGLAKRQIQKNKFETDRNYQKDNQIESRPNQRKIIHIQPRRRIKTQLNQRQGNDSRMLTDKQKTFLKLLKSKEEQLLNKIKSEIGNNPKPFFGDSYELKPKHISTQFERNDHKFDDGRDCKPNKINPITKTYEVSKMLPVLSVASTKPKKQKEPSYLAFSPYLMKRQKQSEYSTNLSRDQTSKSMRSPNYSMKVNNYEPVIGRYNEKNYESSDREYRTQNISEKYERLKRLMRRIQ